MTRHSFTKMLMQSLSCCSIHIL